MMNQCNLLVLKPDVRSPSALVFLGYEVPRLKRVGLKRVGFVCKNAQATSSDDEGWKIFTTSFQPLTLRCSAAVMFASFALGIRAASASSSATQGQVPGYECHPITRDEVKLFSDSVELDASRFSATLRVMPLHDIEVEDNILRTTAREVMQEQTPKDNDCDAHEAYRDSIYRKLRIVFDGRMQDASTHICELQMKSTVDESSWTQSCESELSQRSAGGKDMGKPSQELVSASFKLTVPLRVVSLRGSLPPVWLKDFVLSQGKRVKLSIESRSSLNEMMSALRTDVGKKDIKPKSILAADLVTVGDSWLQLAVSGGWIQPIKDAEKQVWFNRLGATWQALVRRDQDGGFSREGLVWGVPYRWGSMVIAYKRDRLLKNNIPAIEDWNDLWRPELKGQIAMVDSPREVVGAVLKSLGASYNAQDFDNDVKGGREAVKRQFLALQKQVKVFDSVHYLKAFGSDDVCVAVGWSSDVIPVAKRMSNVRVVTPKSGVSLWADLWAIPAANSVSTKKIGSRVHAPSPLIHQWFDFCLQPARSLPFMQGIFTGVSPLFFLKGDVEKGFTSKAIERTFGVMMNNTTGPAMDTNMIEGMPPTDCLEKSELLEPLSEKAIAEYRWLFLQAVEQDSSRQEWVEKVKGSFFHVAASRSRRG